MPAALHVDVQVWFRLFLAPLLGFSVEMRISLCCPGLCYTVTMTVLPSKPSAGAHLLMHGTSQGTIVQLHEAMLTNAIVDLPCKLHHLSLTLESA